MLLPKYYAIRARRDGRYLVARPTAGTQASQQEPSAFILLFPEKTDAMSYLNTHAGGLTQHFTIETISREQLASEIQRWGFSGVGIVRDPLVPDIEFLLHERT